MEDKINFDIEKIKSEVKDEKITTSAENKYEAPPVNISLSDIVKDIKKEESPITIPLTEVKPLPVVNSSSSSEIKYDSIPLANEVSKIPEKQQIINKINNDAELNERGIKAVDEKTYKKLKKYAVGITAALAIIALALLSFAIIAMSDGTLLSSPPVLNCGNNSVTVAPTVCPTCPSVPSFNLTCPNVNVSYSPSITLRCNNSA